MIDLLAVFTTGGVVLWRKELQKVPPGVLNGFVSDVIVDGEVYRKGNYNVKYSISNELGLVFVAVYQSILQLSYAEELVQDTRKIFISLFGEQVKEGFVTSQDFEFSTFEDLVDARVGELDAASPSPSDQQTQQPGNEPEPEPEQEQDQDQSVDESATTPGTPTKPKKKRGGGGKKKAAAAAAASSSAQKPKKQMRSWDNDGNMDENQDVVLDYSAGGENQDNFNADDQVSAAKDWGSSNKKGEFVIKELRDILDNDDEQTPDGQEAKGGSFGFLRNFIGGKQLDSKDLEKANKAMREHLLKKNVASEVADHLCQNVEKSLIGSKTQSWTTVEATVRSAMTESLRKILTPKTSLDLLHEVQTSKKSGRPYVISVVGVNGVGKSTNLSKLGFWLLQNKYKVLVAACDTFRSGAVEQLKVHVRRLQELTNRLGSGEVQIFDEGYGKDAAVIAQKAIDFGQRNGFDVVLIDTAGRRHNDERLMSSLEKFGKLAQPDKIIMVGEALVGTDSVQQARNFNSAFGPSRNLDFFLISKCDTVGDMIGSMVNMTYSTGIPVLFVGVGQNYTDLRTLSVEWAVNLLMS